MALVDVDSWVTEYESCTRLNSAILAQLHQRENCGKFSNDYNRLSSTIQVGLKQFDNEVQQLKWKLNEAAKQKAIHFEEIERRLQQLDVLQSQCRQLHETYLNTTRSAVLSEKVASGLSNWTEDDNVPAAQSNPTDVEALRRHQISVMEQQNRGLENLTQTLSRQKSLAVRFGQEVEDQNEILDNLANTIERVETGVSHETRNISFVSRRDSSTWRYWLVIVVLFVAIVIVALL